MLSASQGPISADSYVHGQRVAARFKIMVDGANNAADERVSRPDCGPLANAKQALRRDIDCHLARSLISPTQVMDGCNCANEGAPALTGPNEMQLVVLDLSGFMSRGGQNAGVKDPRHGDRTRSSRSLLFNDAVPHGPKVVRKMVCQSRVLRQSEVPERTVRLNQRVPVGARAAPLYVFDSSSKLIGNSRAPTHHMPQSLYFCVATLVQDARRRDQRDSICFGCDVTPG
jgi:hypothetical protein